MSQRVDHSVIRIMNKVNLLEALASLGAKVVSAGDLTEQIISAVDIAGFRWSALKSAVLIPEVLAGCCLILSNVLSEIHD